MIPKADRTREEVVERMRSLMQAVRSGEMTPNEAEDRCTRDGLPSPYEGWKDLHDITTNSVWQLPLVVLFYAWRDLVRTREQWERYRVWGRHLQSDEPDDTQVMPLDEAEALLKSDLSQGILRAFGTDAEGGVRPITYNEWKDLTFSGDRDFNVVDASGVAVYSGAFVLRHELVPLLISEHAETTKPEGEPALRERGNQPAPKRGGRPPVYDWDAMWIEIVRLATEDKITDRPALSRHLLAWFAERGSPEPGESIFKEKMSKLFRTLGWE